MITNTDIISARRQDLLLSSVERQFRREVIDVKDNFIEQASRDYKQTGYIREVSFNNHVNEMTEVFKKNYRKAIRVFSLEIEKIAQKSCPAAVLEKKAEAWEFFLIQWMTQQGAKRVRQTSDTTRIDVQQAIKEGIDSELPEEQVIKKILAVKQFSPWRADAIARTETHAAAMFASKETASKIMIENDVVLKKQWVPVQDGRTREDHSAMASQPAIGMDAKFTVGGEKMDRPGDPTASARNVINCLHPETKVWGASPNALTRRFYKGSLVRIKCANGNNITVTPNHPILTRRGWIIASKLRKGQSVVSTNNVHGEAFGNFDIKNIIAPIENIYNSAGIVPVSMGMSGVDVDFHGESIADKNIDVVFKNRKLRNCLKPLFFDPFRKFKLPSADILQGSSLAQSLVNIPFFGGFHFTPRFVRFFDLIAALVGCHFRPFNFFGIRLISWCYAIRDKSSINNAPINAKFFRNLVDGFAAIKHTKNFGYEFVNTTIIGHEVIPYEGYVYNLSDDKSYYIGNGIVTHNCRCVMTYKSEVLEG